MLLPQPWHEFSYARCQVHCNALQHVHNVGVQVDAVQPASPDQAVDDARVLGTHLGPAEQPIAPAYRKQQVNLRMSGKKLRSTIGGARSTAVVFGSSTERSALAARLFTLPSPLR